MQGIEPIVIGIDPGLAGGIAIICGSHFETHAIPILTRPTRVKSKKRKSYNMPAIANLIMDAMHIFIERQQSFPGQGLVSTGKILEGFGLLQGLCWGIGIEPRIVQPKAWQKLAYADAPEKAIGKDRSFFAVRKFFGDINLHRTPRCPTEHDGMADALLIAMHGQHVLREEEAQGS